MIKNINVNEADFIRFNKFVINRLSKSKVATTTDKLKHLALWFIIGLALTAMFRGNANSIFYFHWQTGLFTAIPFVLFIAFIIFNSKRLEKKLLPNSNGLMLGDKELKFCDSGITDTSSLGYSFYKWKAVREVVINDGDLYIFLDKTLAEIIPYSSFSDANEIDQLVCFIEERSCNKQSQTN